MADIKRFLQVFFGTHPAYASRATLKKMGEMQAEIESLREQCRIMRSYAGHRMNCDRRRTNGARFCDCGYDELFRAKGPRAQELADYDDTFQ